MEFQGNNASGPRIGELTGQIERKWPATRAYLDYNASAPLLPAARAAMLAALDVAANPSSVHGEGRAARRLIEDARRDVAALVGARPEHVVFTSGATEAASTLLTPDWQMGARAAAHGAALCLGGRPSLPAGRRPFPRGAASRRSPVDGDGVLDLGALSAALAAP